MMLCPLQELADELFDAVLSGSMDEKKNAITKVEATNAAPPKVTQTKAKAKKDTSGNPASKLSIYVGNFPWVSITVCVTAFHHHC